MGGILIHSFSFFPTLTIWCTRAWIKVSPTGAWSYSMTYFSLVAFCTLSYMCLSRMTTETSHTQKHTFFMKLVFKCIFLYCYCNTCIVVCFMYCFCYSIISWTHIQGIHNCYRKIITGDTCFLRKRNKHSLNTVRCLRFHLCGI